MSNVFMILTLIASLVVIVSVTAQPDKSGGLSGAISGGASESAWSQGKGRSFEVILNKIIILAGIVVVISAVSLSVLNASSAPVVPATEQSATPVDVAPVTEESAAPASEKAPTKAE